MLKEPELIERILRTMVPRLKIPVTCKIRILPSIEDTVALALRLEAAGAAMVTVHGRTITEKQQVPQSKSLSLCMAQPAPFVHLLSRAV